ncbi:MAG: exostosin family protein [Anaerolineae bacterium]|nr:exostosin family protein [Anaerolineae bacterium]
MKLFADKQYLPSTVAHLPLLYPFWGILQDSPAGIDQQVYDDYLRRANSIFTLTPLEQADAAIFPSPWEDVRNNAEAVAVAEKLAREAEAKGKPLIVFYRGDYEFPLPFASNNVYFFRTSLTRSKRQPQQYTLPAWSADFTQQYSGGQLSIRQKTDLPVIGFCGDVGSGSTMMAKLGRWIGQYPALWKLARRFGVELIKHSGSRLRLHALRTLSRSKRVKPNFVLRYSFWNGAVYRSRVLDADKVRNARQEYANNMLNSDYILCLRGKGNFSYRLYETLSCGRIPILLDSDAVMPFEEWIDWSQYGVWAKEADLPRLGDMVADFHARLSEQAFVELQQKCRALWVEWLSPSGFYGNMGRYFESRAADQTM